MRGATQRRRRPALARAAVVTAVITVLISACGTAAAPAPAASRQSGDVADLNAALQRWEQCVQRFDDPDARTLATPASLIRERIRVDQHLLRACEGHRRDVAQRFPRHLESRVHARLEARTQRRAVLGERAPEAGTDTLIDAVIATFPEP